MCSALFAVIAGLIFATVFRSTHSPVEALAMFIGVPKCGPMCHANCAAGSLVRRELCALDRGCPHDANDCLPFDAT
jgi:hypothetical protein